MLREAPIGLTLARLRTLRCVAECRSFAEAARELGVSQPAVSQHVRELEAAYGVRLFSRERGALTPTPLCAELSEIAERMSLDGDAAERLLTRHRSFEHGSLAVGLGNTMPGMAVVAAFHRSHPNVRLIVENGSHEQITRAVLTRTVSTSAFYPMCPRTDASCASTSSATRSSPSRPQLGLARRGTDWLRRPCRTSADLPIARLINPARRRSRLPPRRAPPAAVPDARHTRRRVRSRGQRPRDRLHLAPLHRPPGQRQPGGTLDGSGTHSEVAFALASEKSQLLTSFFECLRASISDRRALSADREAMLHDRRVGGLV